MKVPSQPTSELLGAVMKLSLSFITATSTQRCSEINGPLQAQASSAFPLGVVLPFPTLYTSPVIARFVCRVTYFQWVILALKSEVIKYLVLHLTFPSHSFFEGYYLICPVELFSRTLWTISYVRLNFSRVPPGSPCLKGTLSIVLSE